MMPRFMNFIRDSRITILKIIWLGLAALTVIVLVAAIGPRYQNLSTVHAVETGIGDLQTEDAGALEAIGLSVRYYAIHFTVLETLAALSFFAVSCLIFFARQDDYATLLIATLLVSFGMNASPFLDALILVKPGWSIPVNFLRFFGLTGAIFIFFVFPDGRFVPRWSRWLLPAWIIYTAFWLFSTEVQPVVRVVIKNTSELINYLFLWTMLGLSVIAQFYRYVAVSTPTQRQQTRWIVFAGVITVSVGSVVSALVLLLPGAQEPGVLNIKLQLTAFTAILLFINLIAVATAFAILRYRLYSIDIIIRRTLVYGLVTVLLGLLYFGGVTLLQSLLISITGQQSTLAIVITTLLIAALFNPLRQRVQRVVDRRFFRASYDAQQTLEHFSESVRDEIDIDDLELALLKAVNETLQPASIRLWIKDTL